MSFSVALVQAHSTEDNEVELVSLLFRLVEVWEKIDSLPNGSADQTNQIIAARELVDQLRNTWNLSNEEIAELDAAEFRLEFEPYPHLHKRAC